MLRPLNFAVLLRATQAVSGRNFDGKLVASRMLKTAASEYVCATALQAEMSGLHARPFLVYFSDLDVVGGAGDAD